MTQAATAAPTKEKKAKRQHVLPSVDNNRRVLAECTRTMIDIKRVMETFSCSRNDAIVLAAAAEGGWAPTKKA